MNQILNTKNIDKKTLSFHKKKSGNLKEYYRLFATAIIVLLFFLVFYIIKIYNLSKINKTSQKILTIYDIKMLYGESDIYDVPSVVTDNGDTADVIGIIEIDNINLRLPILSKTTDELLKIAPCKFYGNNINQYGNFCIVGHNFDNGEFFSDLKKIKIGDTICLYTLNGLSNLYIVYNKYETHENDVSCLEQNTNFKEITLITCNNQNKKRLIIKAKER